MRLLFDQNISFKVSVRLRPLFPECEQVRKLGLENKSDREIWEFAKANGYTLVSFDADFYDLVTLLGHPPKLIWLRTGNMMTGNLVEKIQDYADIIRLFVEDEKYTDVACLEIG